jgi:hypothetical protein
MSSANTNFDSVHSFFDERIKKAKRMKNIQNVLRVSVGILATMFAVVAPFASLSVLVAASSLAVVATQANEVYKKNKAREQALRSVPTNTAEDFTQYLLDQKTRPVVEKRLDAIRAAYQKAVGHSVAISGTAGLALVLSYVNGSIVMPIIMGLVAVSETNIAYKQNRSAKSLAKEISQSNGNLDKLIDLADEKEQELQLGEVIHLIEKPQALRKKQARILRKNDDPSEAKAKEELDQKSALTINIETDPESHFDEHAESVKSKNETVSNRKIGLKH